MKLRTRTRIFLSCYIAGAVFSYLDAILSYLLTGQIRATPALTGGWALAAAILSFLVLVCFAFVWFDLREHEKGEAQ